MTYINEPGDFLATPIRTGILTFDSAAVAVEIEYQVSHQWSRQDQDWFEVHGDSGHNSFYVSGRVWVIKKDGTPNEKTALNLAKCLGWQGDLLEFSEPRDWPEVRITVKAESYEKDGEWREVHRVAWINPAHTTPRASLGNIDGQDLEGLARQYTDRFQTLIQTSGLTAAVESLAPPLPKEPPRYDGETPF